jgi:hypothetical protein|nr:hypothetical protein [Candidatus Acidoferrales bacterium]
MSKKTNSQDPELQTPSAGKLTKAEKAAIKQREDAALAAPTADFADGRQLAKAIAQQCDLVAIGSKLLRDGNAKGASVRARMFETTVEYLYGKPAAAASDESAEVHFVCDIPRPVRN